MWRKPEQPHAAFASAEDFLAGKIPSSNVCLLTDIDLPGGMNGIDSCKTLAVWRNLPTIVMTRNKSESDRKKARAALWRFPSQTLSGLARSRPRIQYSTFNDWITAGRRDLSRGYASKEAKLLVAIEAAEALCQDRLIKRIQQAGEGGIVRVPVRQPDGSPVLDKQGQPVTTEQFIRPRWEAAAWTLERRFPDSYGKRNEVNVTHNDSRPRSTLSSEEPDKVISLYEQARALLEAAREMAKERARRRLEGAGLGCLKAARRRA